MPSALETLIKILRLEQETGYKNTAVIGGLQSYAPNWAIEAHQQAKTDRQHALVEELGKVIMDYASAGESITRQRMIKYMLGRITGRVDPKTEYTVELSQADIAQLKSSPESSPAKSPTETPQKLDEADDVISAHLEVEQIVESAREPSRKPKPRRSPRQPIDLENTIGILRQLNTPVNKLHGVGNKRTDQLARLGIFTLNDLLFHFPRRYDDYTRMTPLKHLPPGQQIAAIGKIRRVSEHIARQGRPYIRAEIEDGGGRLGLTFFNQPYLKRALEIGTQICVYGKVELFRGQPMMTNPDWESIDQRSLRRGSIVPVYPLTQGISSKIMRKLIKQVVDEWTTRLPDYVPESVLERTEMADLGWAIQQVHFPQSWEYIDYARERLAFDELLLLQLGVLAKRRDWQVQPGIPLPIDDASLEAFKASLPYELTTAQLRAINVIREDMQRNVPMNRLLQGDVGAGKTVIAAAALRMAVVNGKQVALMAPTSILAEQHYHNLCDLLGSNGVNIQLLTGATSDSERQQIYSGLADGSVQIIVGTHALIQSRVEFRELALAIIDEQHRFGVEERGILRGKGTNPHVLVMTATPIPRTLALTMFADLDLTILDEMPPGRTPIKTRLLYKNEVQRAYSFIRSQLEQGRQAFIIYPLVEASDRLDSGSAVEAYEDLQTNIFPDYRLGLMHGRLSPSEKDAVMLAFAQGEVDVLISTTVIEVGIDVPNASVILIQGANRFGLAQLHQLRGRVGRGTHQSFCLLVSDSEEPEERLKKLEETNDGFELAELDWQLRGPGDLLGTRQAGFAPVRMDSVMNIELVELAQQESRTIFAEDADLSLPEHALLAQRIYTLQHRQTDIS